MGEVRLLDISGLRGQIVPITQFNKGKASQLFMRANKGEALMVIKNNAAFAVILSPDEYDLLRGIQRLCRKSLDNENNTFPDELTDLLDKLKTLDENGENNV